MEFEDQYEQVSVDRIKAGDTVLIDGVHKTVCRKDLGHDGLLGPTLWGDSHRAGHDKITRITFGAEIARRETARQRDLEGTVTPSAEPDDRDDFPDPC